MWCNTGDVPHFLQFNVPRISHTSLLPAVVENNAYTNLTRGDAQETGQLVKYGGLISFSMEAVVNNDVNSFNDQATSCGEAAMATLDTNVYSVLLANPTMGDGNSLFDAINHDNDGANALTAAGIDATRVAIGRQEDDNPGVPRKLGIRMPFILVPLELESQGKVLRSAEYTTQGGGEYNPVRDTFDVIATHQLTDATDWYGLARKGKTFRVFLLDGQLAPVVEQDEGWSVDAIHFKVRHVHDVVPQDWRGMVRNVVAG